jgi:hypothetical protein
MAMCAGDIVPRNDAAGAAWKDRVKYFRLAVAMPLGDNPALNCFSGMDHDASHR